jgi:hypothetical protein
VSVLRHLPPAFEPPLFVFNDADAALQSYLESLESEGSIRALYIPFRLGKSEAMRCGLEKLMSISQATIIAQTDGHSKQPPSHLAELVSRLMTSDADIVIADRYDARSLDDHRAAVVIFFSSIIRHLTGYSLADTVCGTRVYARWLANIFLRRSSMFGYGFELEQLLLAATSGAQAASCPIPSKTQDSHTSAEKVEDNIATLAVYANSLNMTRDLRAWFSFILMSIKERQTFVTSLAIVDRDSLIEFRHLAPNDAYQFTIVP